MNKRRFKIIANVVFVGLIGVGIILDHHEFWYSDIPIVIGSTGIIVQIIVKSMPVINYICDWFDRLPE